MKLTLTYLSLFLCSFAAFLSPFSHANGFLKDEYVLDSAAQGPVPFRVPEGVAFDPFTGNFYATSIFGGRITKVSGFSSAESEFYFNPAVSFAGAVVAPLRRILWVCGVDSLSLSTFPTSQLYAIDLNTGNLLKAFDLVDPGLPFAPAFPFFCNDVTLDQQGNAYVTNSLGPSVMKVSPNAINDPAGEAVPFATSPLLLPDFSIPDALGQNGIVVTPTNSHLLVAISVPSKLMRISLSDPNDVSEVTFSGDVFGDPDPFDNNFDFFAPDGMQFVWGKLYVVYHEGIRKLSFSDLTYSHASIKSKTSVPKGLSTATRAYGKLYVIDSEVVPVTRGIDLPVDVPNKILKVSLGGFN